MLDVFERLDVRIVVRVDEVSVVGQPANPKVEDQHHQHFDNLQVEEKHSITSTRPLLREGILLDLNM